MTFKIIFRLLIFYLFFYSNLVNASENIAYLDLPFLMNTSEAGKSISSQLKKKHQSNLKKFKETEESLKKEEAKIISQKNILEKDEYQKKITLLREKVMKYRGTRKKAINELNENKIKAEKKLIEALTPILANYSKEKSISLIIQKKNIIIGKSELDITKQILTLLNKETKDIKLD